MKVAVIGGGISGVAAAYHLDRSCDVTIFEAEPRLGGHTDTHHLTIDEKMYAIDTGFIVFNERNYPQFSAFLDSLGVASHESDMSFGVQDPTTGYAYGSAGWASIFPTLREFRSPSHWAMLLDIRRFYRLATATRGQWPDIGLGEFLAREGFSDAFRDRHLVPMCGALWSASDDDVLDIPIRHVLGFMDHHTMLQLDGRPLWRVVTGGSSSYLQAFQTRFKGRIALDARVSGIERTPGQVRVTVSGTTEIFDAVVIAVHADQALGMLDDPSPAERQILGAMRYQPNRVVLHSDPSFMPAERRAWSSWNGLMGDGRGDARVTYWMNRLQRINGPDFFVTLNPDRKPKNVWLERHYAHPIYDTAAHHAQERIDEISGMRQTYYCGAYWGWGFHEDGFASATTAVERLLEVRRAAA